MASIYQSIMRAKPHLRSATLDAAENWTLTVEYGFAGTHEELRRQDNLWLTFLIRKLSNGAPVGPVLVYREHVMPDLQNRSRCAIDLRPLVAPLPDDWDFDVTMEVSEGDDTRRRPRFTTGPMTVFLPWPMSPASWPPGYPRLGATITASPAKGGQQLRSSL